MKRSRATTKLVVFSLLMLAPVAVSAQWGGRFEMRDRELVEMFDTDGDGVLDAKERDAARAAIGTTQSSRRGGWPRRSPFGGGDQTSGYPGISLGQDDVRIYGDEDLYDPAVLRTIFLEFENEDWEQELEAFYNTDVEVPAAVTVDRKVYPNVGVHFRGQSSYRFASTGSKRSLNLSFDFIDDDQRLLTYKTLNLLNANGDSTFLRAVYYSRVARAYIPAPRINFVRVVINGENWGIYLNAQQFNKDFARDWFGTTKGARWKVPGSPNGGGSMDYFGENIDTYRALYEIRSKDKEESWRDLLEMFRVLNETPADDLVAELSPLLDIDGVLRFLALDIALVNSDGYWTRGSDYSIYQDKDGKFHVIPHDINEGLSFEGGGPPGRFGGPRGSGDFSSRGVRLDPLTGLNDWNAPLRTKLLAVPELRERYLGYVRDIARTWLDWKKAEPTLQAYRDLIAEDVERDTRKLYSTAAFDEDFDGSAQSLKTFIVERQAYLLDD